MHTIDEIINDLLEINPREVPTMPPPYDENQTLNEKVEITYRSSPKQQTEYLKRVTKHYYTAAIRTYWLFEAYGIEQVYRTQKLILADLA
ncbi:4318_t:CDS:2, partial [Cetraspora pellucida]